MSVQNSVHLYGNMTRDPEIRYTPKGTAVCEIAIAITKKFKDQTGNMQEQTSFIDCTAFGVRAEAIGKYFAKGNPILIQGELKQDTWEDKQSGQKRSKLKVMIEGFGFTYASTKRDQQPNQGYNQSSPPTQNQPSPQTTPKAKYYQESIDDNEVPF